MKIGFEYRKRNSQAGQNGYRGVAFRMGNNVRIFLEQDSNSRITTGKRDTLTRYGDKRLSRVLLDSLDNLHTKYYNENDPKTMSYSLFCKLKPFHIVQPTNRDREICLCKIHENAELMLLKLCHLQLLPWFNNTVEKCVEALCCPGGKEDCHYRRCQVCKNNTILNYVPMIQWTQAGGNGRTPSMMWLWRVQRNVSGRLSRTDEMEV